MKGSLIGWAVILTLAILARTQVSIWTSDQTLWRHETLRHPQSLRAWMNLEAAAILAGDCETTRRASSHAARLSSDMSPSVSALRERQETFVRAVCGPSP